MPADKVILSLGSNLGDKNLILKQAVSLLAQEIHAIKISSVYRTSPVDHRPERRQPVYYNLAVSGMTSLSPEELLGFIGKVEKTVTDTVTASGFPAVDKRDKGPRYVDVDIIFHGDWVMKTPTLTLPHPAYRERLFVLVPVTEIEPEWQDPTTEEGLKDRISSGDFSGQNIFSLGPLSLLKS